MKWENFNLHIENLFPGIVSLILILSLLSKDTEYNLPKLLENNKLLSNMFFISLSYLLGIFIVIVSRCFIDFVSEWRFRPVLLKLLAHPENTDITNWDFKEINKEFRERIRIVLNSENVIIKNEVLKRRERGRLIRTTLIPAILMIFAFNVDDHLCCKIIYSVVVFLVITLLYAYAEVCIYKECRLAND